MKRKHTERDIEVAQEHLQIVLVKLGAAMAVFHEGAENDFSTLGEMLQDINLEAWRLRWQLNTPNGAEIGGAS